MNEPTEEPRPIEPDVYCSDDPWRGGAAYVRLVWHMTKWRLASRYRHTVLGYLWSWLTPLATMALYYLVFRYVFKAGATDARPFVVLFLPAFFLWNAMAAATAEGAYAFHEAAGAVRGVGFPRSSVVASVVVANFVHLAVAVPPLILALWVLGSPPGVNLMLLPVVLLLAGAFVLGVVLFVSAASVIYPDVPHLLQIAVSASFFLSPVAYSVERLPLPPAWKGVYVACWPPAAILELGRAAFLGDPVDEAMLLSALPGVLLAVCVGLLYGRSRQALVETLL